MKKGKPKLGGVERLLAERKRQAGLGEDELYCIGVADTAQWWWCGMQSLLKNEEMEPWFFLAHLEDRLDYSIQLGYVDEKIRDRPIEEVAYELDLSRQDVERILETRKSPPKIPEAGAKSTAKLYAEAGPKRRGIEEELQKAERYPTVRWAFRWRDFLVHGVPDGITDEFVYEFKTTKKEYYLQNAKPIAFTQADLYGHFFERPKKRVQIYIEELGEARTWEELVDSDRAEKTLDSLWRAAREGEVLKTSKKWKCKVCDYKEICN